MGKEDTKCLFRVQTKPNITTNLIIFTIYNNLFVYNNISYVFILLSMMYYSL